MGKKSGVLIGGTPKYLHARSESNLEYVALAGRVNGGLLPGFLMLSIYSRKDGSVMGRKGWGTGTNVDASQKDRVEPKIAVRSHKETEDIAKLTRPPRRKTLAPCDSAADTPSHSMNKARL